MKIKKKYVVIGSIVIAVLVVFSVLLFILLSQHNKYYFSKFSGLKPSYTDTLDGGSVNEYYPHSIDWFEVVAYMDWLEDEGFEGDFLGIQGRDYKYTKGNDVIFVCEYDLMYSGYMSFQYQINLEE